MSLCPRWLRAALLSGAFVVCSLGCSDSGARERAKLYDRVAAAIPIAGSPPTPATLERARQLDEQGRVGEAVHCLMVALRDGLDPLEGLPALATLLEKMQELELADSALRLAIDVAPDPLELQFTLAEARIRARDYSGARQILETIEAAAEQASERTARASFLTGVSFQNELRLDEAQVAFARSRELAPLDVQVALKISQVHSMQGDEDSALAVLEEILAERPRFLPAWTDVAKLHYRQERFARALEAGLTVLRIEPDHRRMLFLVSQCQRRLGHEEQAFETFARFTRAEERANELRSHQSKLDALDILVDKARAALESDRIDEARDAVRQALEIDPDHAAAKNLQAELAAGQRSESRR